jgi:hypothetical protein
VDSCSGLKCRHEKIEKVCGCSITAAKGGIESVAQVIADYIFDVLKEDLRAAGNSIAV